MLKALGSATLTLAPRAGGGAEQRELRKHIGRRGGAALRLQAVKAALRVESIAAVTRRSSCARQRRPDCISVSHLSREVPRCAPRPSCGGVYWRRPTSTPAYAYGCTPPKCGTSFLMPRRSASDCSCARGRGSERARCKPHRRKAHRGAAVALREEALLHLVVQAEQLLQKAGHVGRCQLQASRLRKVRGGAVSVEPGACSAAAPHHHRVVLHHPVRRRRRHRRRRAACAACTSQSKPRKAERRSRRDAP